MLSKKLHAQLKDSQLTAEQQQKLFGGYREVPFTINATTRVRWDEVIIRFGDEQSNVDFRPGQPSDFGRGGGNRLFRPIP